MHQVLQLDIQGMPQAWISPQAAAIHYATESVTWTVGAPLVTLRGGVNARSGIQSSLQIHPIIALNGASRMNLFDAVPGLNNRKLFRRDRFTCAYCGLVHREDRLTREHIVPVSAGGPDVWTNVVTACGSCNGRKSNRTPEQAGMPLLYLPYVPSVYEGFILGSRRIRADVHEWLAARLPKGSRLV